VYLESDSSMSERDFVKKTVCEMDRCTGCMACLDICPKEAIQIEDSIFSYNAVINKDKCVGCNLCHKVCNVNNTPKQIEPIFWKQGWSKNKDVRRKSSSGGVAAELEREFVNSGGVVFSCTFVKGEFVFRSAITDEEVSMFRGSKYVKSNPQGVYKKIDEFLKKGKKVLFVGLPCQVAAVKNYVDCSDLLTTIDLICHGTPSPIILKMFLEERNIDINCINNISFRIKETFGLMTNELPMAKPGLQDYYIKTFLESVDYTENCYFCSYAKLERVSDITLGDSWGSSLSEDELKNGVSLILCQTEKGKDLIKDSKLKLYDVDLKNAVAENAQLSHPAKKPAVREKFVKAIENGKRYHRVIFECFPKRYIKNYVKSLLINLNIIQGEYKGISYNVVISSEEQNKESTSY